MKCYKCGVESAEDFTFCPKCGADQRYAPAEAPDASQTQRTAVLNGGEPSFDPGEPSAGAGTMSGYILTTLRDGLFLAICILFSVSAVFSLFNRNISVITILFTIFLWLAYAKAQKGVASREHLRCISGTVFASYVVGYVIAGCVALVGLMMVVMFGGGNGIFLAEILEVLENEIGTFGNFYDLYGSLVVSGIAAFMGVIVILIAAGVAVVNYFATRSIHRFVQSVYQSIGKNEAYLAKVNAAKNWLMAFGIIEAISSVQALGNRDIISFISTGSAAAAYIIGSIIIKKYYCTKV